ncbi:MAG: tetratricopeptide repeat protein, partial [Crocinitomicaceae bacterium]|nr:tetratricopeptide repeat protein [Crocinitomicaceae bacterium]
MKFGLFFISLLTFCACSIGQTKYSTTNKKAIKLFEQGHLAPSQSIDQQTNLPNYKGGIVLMNQALEKDPNFWEAHMVAGEFCEYLGRNEEAIKHYEAALSINPNHSPSGSTYYFLASLQHLTGDYVNSNKNIDLFVRNRNANQQLVNKAYEIQANNDFAIHSLASPTNFNPVNIGPGINTADHEYFPTITVDGKTILFTRR